MKTRTLLLLSLATGLAIMLAGAVFLFQLASTDDVAEPIEIGESVEIGDMSVTVLDSTESAGALTVRVEIGGVDDPDGASGFRLIASGRPLSPRSADGAGAIADECGASGVDARTCVVVFDTSSADGSSRVLFYDRGDESARWVLG